VRNLNEWRDLFFLQNDIKADRRIQGIRPLLPPPEEREEIKRAAFAHLKH
jgi:hypothetical protein